MAVLRSVIVLESVLTRMYILQCVLRGEEEGEGGI